MADSQDQMKNQLFGLVQRLTPRQKLTVGGITFAALAAIVALVVFINKPSYGTLFSNLNPQDASKIVEKLKEKSVKYVLDDGGKTILVPKQQLYDMRLSLAGEGLPQSSVIGYEIFDRTNLGVSDFVQKVNYRRALEGELARTILQLEEVEGARVHIVVPEKALFKEDEKPATASVVLKLKSDKPLRPEEIQGITHLVSSSVEALDPSNVAVLDSRGRLLSDNEKPNSIASLTSTQYELQQKVESYLSQKAQSMMDGALGTGNAIVQVAAELDFSQVDRTLEQYDPDKATVRSEQTTEEKASSKDASPSTHTNTITNYEINKSVEHIVENQGNIKRLSIAVMVNGVPKTAEKNGETVTDYAPRPQDEINKLTEVIKRAVGYDPQRKDEISVANLPFGTNGQKDDFLYRETPFTNWTQYTDKIVLVLAMLGAVLILRSLLGRLRFRRNDAAGERTDSGELAGGGYMLQSANYMNSENRGSTERRKLVTRYVKEQPEKASRLLKVWLADN